MALDPKALSRCLDKASGQLDISYSRNRSLSLNIGDGQKERVPLQIHMNYADRRLVRGGQPLAFQNIRK